MDKVDEILIGRNLNSIFASINNIRDILYEQIKNRHLDTTEDILDAMTNTGISDIYKNIEIHGRQWDVGKILKDIDTYIYYDIEYRVTKDQWEDK